MGGARDETLLNDVYILRDNETSWIHIILESETIWSPRRNFGCVAVGDVIYVSGGCGVECCFNDLWKSEDYGSSWELLSGNMDFHSKPEDCFPGKTSFWMGYKESSDCLVVVGGEKLLGRINS